jgi:hypothetical protein
MTLTEELLAVLFGAFAPARRLDRWFARLPWRRKALWYAAIAVLAVVGSALVSRDHRPE